MQDYNIKEINDNAPAVITPTLNPPKNRKPRLPSKEKRAKYIKAFVKSGFNKQEALRAVEPNWNENSLENNATREYNRLMSIDGLTPNQSALKKYNLDTNSLHPKLQTMLNATKQVVLERNLVSVEDNPIQLEALKTAYKLNGLLLPQQNNYIDQRSVTFNASDEKIAQLSEIVGKLEGITNRLRDSKISGEIEVKRGVGVPG